VATNETPASESPTSIARKNEGDQSRNPDAHAPPDPAAPERPNQHDLMRLPESPKKDVADALEHFDGDEN
jgi:hypothetical protein